MNVIRNRIRDVLNEASAENMSNTPDFILAEYLIGCLDNFDRTVRERDTWYGIRPSPGNPAGKWSAFSENCSVCGESQYKTPSGMTCKNAHDGARGLMPGETPEETPHSI